MKTDYLIIKKEELMSIIKELSMQTEVKLHPLTSASNIIDDISLITTNLNSVMKRLTNLEKTKYYSGSYETFYFKVPKSVEKPKELELRISYSFKDTSKPTENLTSVSAFYISRSFIDGNSNTGVLNMGTNKTGISYLHSVVFELVKDTVNNEYYIKMKVGAKKSPDINLLSMSIWFYSENVDWEMYPESRLTSILPNITTQITKESELETETLRKEVPDIDKLVRSDDYSFIKSLTQGQFETMKQNETLQEGVLYTTDKVEED